MLGISTHDEHRWRQLPRRVSWLLALQVVLSGPASWFGWSFAGFGGAAAIAFMSKSTLLAPGIDDPTATEATVRSVKETGYSENEQNLWELEFGYSVDGVQYEGRAYDFSLPFNAGETIEAEYDTFRPERSRVPGLRSRPFGPFVAFVLLFPLAGLLVALFGLPRRFRRLRLLRTGKLAHGRLVQTETTKVLVNDQPVCKLTFTFKDDRGMNRNTVVKTHLTDKLEDDEQELLLYDPKQPAVAVLLDELPHKPNIATDGTLSSTSVVRPILALLFPAVAAGACLWVWFLVR